jgi:Tfp pilus assembly major pilin PilA
MKTNLPQSRTFRAQGSVLSHILVATGGALFGGVVCIVGIGILAAVAIPNIGSSRAKSRVVTANAAAHEVKTEAGEPVVELIGLGPPMTVMAKTQTPKMTTNQSLRESMAMRSAQSFASIFAAGEAAGVEWMAHDVESAMIKVKEGGTPKAGPFAGKKFLLSSRDLSDPELAKDYLRWDSAEATLCYDSTDADSSN